MFEILKLKDVWMISLLMKDVQEEIEKKYNRDSVYQKPIYGHDDFINLLNEQIKYNLETTEDVVRVILRDIERQCKRLTYTVHYSLEEYGRIYKKISAKYSKLKEKLRKSAPQYILFTFDGIDLSSVLPNLYHSYNPFEYVFEKCMKEVNEKLNWIQKRHNEKKQAYEKAIEPINEENTLIPIDICWSYENYLNEYSIYNQYIKYESGNFFIQFPNYYVIVDDNLYQVVENSFAEKISFMKWDPYPEPEFDIVKQINNKLSYIRIPLPFSKDDVELKEVEEWGWNKDLYNENHLIFYKIKSTINNDVLSNSNIQFIMPYEAYGVYDVFYRIIQLDKDKEITNETKFIIYGFRFGIVGMKSCLEKIVKETYENKYDNLKDYVDELEDYKQIQESFEIKKSKYKNNCNVEVGSDHDESIILMKVIKKLVEERDILIDKLSSKKDEIYDLKPQIDEIKDEVFELEQQLEEYE